MTVAFWLAKGLVDARYAEIKENKPPYVWMPQLRRLYQELALTLEIRNAEKDYKFALAAIDRALACGTMY